MGKIREYEGKNISVKYDVSRCIHAEECVGRLPSVFERDRRPWIDADAASADEVAAVIERCPTGALWYDRKDGGAAEVVPDRNVARVDADGPVYIRGDLEIVDAEGAVQLECTRLALCRCGASESKPYCDGRHSDVGFSDPGQLADTRPKPEGYDPGGKLRIQPRTNGSVRLEGSVEILSVDGGASRFSDARVHLCRCGASSKKPFCDGTHKTNGFTAD
jgi:CDGSH-type Zn-finger protein/uncharacterized Fe-S cluster protein YjdI